jgi:hypothetical protein
MTGVNEYRHTMANNYLAFTNAELYIYTFDTVFLIFDTFFEKVSNSSRNSPRLFKILGDLI